MIDFISSWAEQIVIVVVVVTIIELILPKNKNKKYIQMVMGLYVLFNIISPIIKNKEEFSVEKYSVDKYETNSQYVVDQTSMDERIEKIYLEELENKVISKFETEGFAVEKCIVDAVLDTNKKNAGIHLITVEISKSVNEERLTKVAKELATEFEIEYDKIKINLK